MGSLSPEEYLKKVKFDNPAGVFSDRKYPKVVVFDDALVAVRKAREEEREYYTRELKDCGVMFRQIRRETVKEIFLRLQNPKTCQVGRKYLTIPIWYFKNLEESLTLRHKSDNLK